MSKASSLLITAPPLVIPSKGPAPASPNHHRYWIRGWQALRLTRRVALSDKFTTTVLEVLRQPELDLAQAFRWTPWGLPSPVRILRIRMSSAAFPDQRRPMARWVFQ